MKLHCDNDKLKRFSIIFAYTIGVIYLLFLILPVVLSPIANSYSQHLADIIKSTTGLDAQVDGLGIVTSPNLSAGIKIKNISISIPASEDPVFAASDLRVKLALLPVIIKKIQLDEVSAKSLNANLVVKKDGSFSVLDYLISKESPNAEPMEGLPYGFKLSNHLPDIKMDNYNFAFVDALDNDKYCIEGRKLKINDFILDKKVKVSTAGKVMLGNFVVSNYDIKIANSIMPDLVLNELVFPKRTIQIQDNVNSVVKNENNFNIIDVFKSIKKNELTADLMADVKASGSLKNLHAKGNISIDALSVAVNGKKLPESYMNLMFKGNEVDIDSILFSSQDENEKTQIIGDAKVGKKAHIDLTFRSNAKFNNLIRLADSIAQSFGVKDFSTLSATGGIDADFNINSDLKNVSSTGYLKINPSKFTYGLYNVVIDKISADIDLMNNNINIKNAGFSILGHSLKLTGSIKQDSDTDLRLVADKLPIKGLLAASGQVALLKDNLFNSGTFSLNAILKGKLKDLKPEINADLADIDILNKSSNVRILLSDSLIRFLSEKKSLTGDINLSSLVLKHPSATISIPETKIVMDSNDIKIKKSYLLLNGSKIDITGSISQYLTDKLNIDILAKGNIASSDIAGFIPQEMRSMFPYAGNLPVSVIIKGNSKVQDICFNLTADNSNYITLADIDLLKNKKAKIHTDIKISGDTLTFSDSGIYANDNKIISLTGGITKLYSEPKVNIAVSIPKFISFPVWGMKTSNITANGDVSIWGNMFNPQFKGAVNVSDISIKDLDFVIKNLKANLNGQFLNGNATAEDFKFGGIVANNISSDFALIDYNNFYLSNLKAEAFSGKIDGKISYSVNNSAIGVELNGTGLNSTEAVYGAVGIKNALTGRMGFSTKLVMQGVTDKEIIQSMKGNVNFNIEDGRFMGIGRLENLVAAQNVASNSILKAAISSLSTLSTIQETNKFKSIVGDISLAGGAANISGIKVLGPLMSYHVSGFYDIIPNSANLTILGRLDSKVVSSLGILGDLSVEKLLANIPKFGVLTSNILKQLTSDPAGENVSLIPALTSGSKSYKDFKVLFIGPADSASSVRSFKWLSKCDTTPVDVNKELENAAEAMKNNITERVENAKTNAQTVQQNVNNIVETHKNSIESFKNDIEQVKSGFEASKENSKNNSENLKNLFKNAIINSQKQMPAPQAQEVTP